MSESVHRYNPRIGATDAGGCLLESDVGVGDQESAENGVHDGVEGAGGEGSNAEGDQTDSDSAKMGCQQSGLLLKDITPFRCIQDVTNRSKVQW